MTSAESPTVRSALVDLALAVWNLFATIFLANNRIAGAALLGLTMAFWETAGLTEAYGVSAALIISMVGVAILDSLLRSRNTTSRDR